MKNGIVFLLVLAFWGGSAYAQISEGGSPPSFGKSISTDISSVTMPGINVPLLMSEDVADEGKDVPYRFGRPFDVRFDLDNSGTWTSLADGSRLWQLRIESPGAYSINLLYDRFWLPEGGRLFLYDETREMVIGAFTDRNNKEHGRFATAPVKGEAVILEYHEPADMIGQGEISISRVVHAYKDIFDFNETKDLLDFGGSGSCNNNVNCPEGNSWQDEKRSVAMILTAGGYRICSGALVNNVRQDGTPYFLTANHCLGGEESWIFMFNYESPNCDDLDGATHYTLSGSTLLANYATSDFALLRLIEQPPDSYQVYFAGWSNEDIAAGAAVGIHHPSGDIKKISFDYDPVVSTDYLGTSGTTHWRVGNWEDGTTEGGSSGSPLFDQNHRVIGQLHGGFASCASITPDWYGKFALSWTGGGSPDSRLRDWLDPDNSGVTVLDGFDPSAGIVIQHSPLPDTYDSVGNYEVVCRIVSDTELVADSLRLYYEINSSRIPEPLYPSGNPHEFSAVIPAQSPGTSIEYFLVAYDLAGRADTTETFSFMVLAPPDIVVLPSGYNRVLAGGESFQDDLVIVNVGLGELTYDIAVEGNFAERQVFDKLLAAGQTEPARRTYTEDILEYETFKGAEDYRMGYMVEKDAGGPDQFGYVWIDSDQPEGPDFEWIDISGFGTDLVSNLADDNYIGPYEIGFEFPFYDSVYSRLYVASNGVIGFAPDGLNLHFNKPIPRGSIPDNFIAWMWDDLNPQDVDNPGAHVYYYSDSGRLIIQFENYPEYSAAPGDVITAQVILEESGDIRFQYLSVAPGFDAGSCAIGLENADGSDGIEVAYLTSYVHDSLAVAFYRPRQWLNLDKSGGILASGQTDSIGLAFSAEGLDSESYSAEVTIASNDPDAADNPIVIPVNMTVTGQAGYTCADVDYNGIINILDVTFILNYLYKGGLPPEPMASADVNSDGIINLLDVTYIINYLYKAGPAPNCPPVE